MYKFHCAVTPTDTLVAYVSDQEKKDQVLFSLVLENAQGQKISVLLNQEDALVLSKQLSIFNELGVGPKP